MKAKFGYMLVSNGQFAKPDCYCIFDDPTEAVMAGIKTYRDGLKPSEPNSNHSSDIRLIVQNCVNSFDENSCILCSIYGGIGPARESFEFITGDYYSYLPSYASQEELVDTSIFKRYMKQVELAKKELTEKLGIEIGNVIDPRQPS